MLMRRASDPSRLCRGCCFALRGGVYARLAYTGPYADMRGAYRRLMRVWLSSSGYQPDDAHL